MSITTDSAAYFDRVAGEWDALRGGYFGEAVRAAAIAKAYLRAEMTVADVGAGTGFMTVGLAPLVRRVVALDGAPAMLEVARRNLAAFDNVTYEVADAAALPLDDASVDAVFANMVLHHCPDPAAAIREMVRVLRPGGRLVITDLDAHDHAWLRTEMADVWLGFPRGQVHAWLGEAGLVNAYVTCTDQDCCAASQVGGGCGEGDAAQAQISVFVAVGARPVRGAQDAVRASYGAAATVGVTGVAAGGSCSCTPTTDSTSALNACCEPAVASQTITLLETGYGPTLLEGVPARAAGFSLGCGVPLLFAALRAGETVLDIGSGGGLDAFMAARQVGAAGHVIGLDMTPQMIERAGRAAAEGSITNVEFRLGQAEAMPVADAEVDVIISNCVINLCEDKGRVFAEAARVLRSGGRLAISDVVSDGALPDSLRRDPAHWAGCVFGALPEAEYLALITAAGLGDVQAVRSAVYGEVEGVHLYSLSVTARK